MGQRVAARPQGGKCADERTEESQDTYLQAHAVIWAVYRIAKAPQRAEELAGGHELLQITIVTGHELRLDQVISLDEGGQHENGCQREAEHAGRDRIYARDPQAFRPPTICLT